MPRVLCEAIITRLARFQIGHICEAFDLHILMCDNLHMATNLALDDRLIEEARRAGKHKTKKDAVTAALDEYIKRHKQLRILDAFGTFEFDPGYDYKAERRGKSKPRS